VSDVVIISAARTPIGRAGRGTLRFTRPDELAAIAMRAAIERAEGLSAGEIEDVILGCATPEGEQGMNVARIAALRAGIPSSVPAFTVNRFCASGLEAVAVACQRILSGQADVVLADGVESMSMVPFEKTGIMANPALIRDCPDIYLNMGMTAENLVDTWSISREEADEFSYQSHMKALAAIETGKFRDEIVPVKARFQEMDHAGRVQTREVTFDTDECPRKETTREALAALKPAFRMNGSITAGNSSQRSDGAAAVILMSAEKAAALGMRPMGRYVGYATAGVPPEIMGIGPAYAIPKRLAKSDRKLEAVEVVELN
jgi:acetyl-CoA acyltransferase